MRNNVFGDRLPAAVVAIPAIAKAAVAVEIVLAIKPGDANSLSGLGGGARVDIAL